MTHDFSHRTLSRKFVLHRRIGYGGMATVYEATNLQVDKRVAVKVLNPEFVTHETVLIRFRQEAKVAAQLRHPNIVEIHDYDVDGELPFIVMEYLEGCSLSDLLHRGPDPLPWRLVADLCAQVCSALQYAHERQVLHRDIKPSNVFLLEGSNRRGDQIKLLDFGIAKVHQHDPHPLTRPSQVPCTPEYMAPEEVQGQPCDARTDVYSLGVMMYRMLAGRLPFYASTSIETLAQHVLRTPPPPRVVAPNVAIPAELEAIVLKALAKAPDQRWSSPRALRDALLALLDGTQQTLVRPPDSMILASPKSRALENFLLEAFTRDECRLFIKRYYGNIFNLIVDSEPYGAYVFEVITTLSRHGFLDADFFRALQQERPQRHERIKTIAEEYGFHIESPPASVQSHPEKPKDKPSNSDSGRFFLNLQIGRFRLVVSFGLTVAAAVAVAAISGHDIYSASEETLRILGFYILCAMSIFVAAIAAILPQMTRSSLARHGGRSGDEPVFISFSQDRKLPGLLQRALERFRTQDHGISVFKDLSGNPDSVILSTLHASKHFIFLASPEAASSKWVERELKECMKLGRRIIVVLTRGDIEWNPILRDFTWSKSTAIPSFFRNYFSQFTFHDLRWTQEKTGLSAEDPEFLRVAAQIASQILGAKETVLLSTLTGDKRRRKESRNLLAGMFLLAIGMLAGAFLMRYY